MPAASGRPSPRPSTAGPPRSRGPATGSRAPPPDRLMFASVAATGAEKQARRPGDSLVHPAGVVMDRAFTAPAPPERVWPWLLQLGKQGAGWCLPARAERFLPRSRRAARVINPAWLGLRPRDVIPGYGRPP